MIYELQDRLDTLGSRLQEVSSELVIYTRGVASLSNLKVTLILADDPEELAPGIVLATIRRQDFLIDSADLILSSALTVPTRGDKITRTNGEVYQITSPGGDLPVFRYTTSSKKRLRIHADLLSK